MSEAHQGGTNCQKCGRAIAPWWDKAAYPYEDEDWAFFAWALTPCECGFAPENLGVKAEKPKTEKK